MKGDAESAASPPPRTAAGASQSSIGEDTAASATASAAACEDMLRILLAGSMAKCAACRGAVGVQQR
jgi:hypothetical protein